jgi:hypothetical protein
MWTDELRTLASKPSRGVLTNAKRGVRTRVWSINASLSQICTCVCMEDARSTGRSFFLLALVFFTRTCTCLTFHRAFVHACFRARDRIQEREMQLRKYRSSDLTSKAGLPACFLSIKSLIVTTSAACMHHLNKIPLPMLIVRLVRSILLLF